MHYIDNQLNSIQSKFEQNTPWFRALDSIKYKQNLNTKLFYERVKWMSLYVGVCALSLGARIYFDTDHHNTNSVSKIGSFFRNNAHFVGNIPIIGKHIVKTDDDRAPDAVTKDLLIMGGIMSSLYIPWDKYTKYEVKNYEFKNKIKRATTLFDRQKEYIHHWAKSALSQWLAHVTKCNNDELNEYFGNGMDITDYINKFVMDKMPPYIKQHTFSDSDQQQEFLDTIDELMNQQIMTTDARKLFLKYVANATVKDGKSVTHELQQELLSLSRTEFSG